MISSASSVIGGRFRGCAPLPKNCTHVLQGPVILVPYEPWTRGPSMVLASMLSLQLEFVLHMLFMYFISFELIQYFPMKPFESPPAWFWPPTTLASSLGPINDISQIICLLFLLPGTWFRTFLASSTLLYGPLTFF